VAVPSFVVSFGALHEARPEALVMTSSPGRASVRHLTAIDVGSNRAPEWLQLACPNPFDPLLAFSGDSAPLELGGDSVRNESDVVVFEDLACASLYGAEDSGSGRRLSGSAIAFGRVVGGRRLTFERHEGGVRDRETHSRWNLLGEAVAGPLLGTRLPSVAQVSGFRFALEGLRVD
jgi:hypothetical protein